MITGATGYVAGWIVKHFLDNGYTLHLPVRDPDNLKKLSHLKELEKNSSGTIVFFKADLLKKDSYLESMQGCDTVIHTASPFKTKVKDPQKDLIEPALYGTENVLNSVNQTPSVKKVVVTSSVVAIVGDSIEFQSGPKDESHWNNTSSLLHQPYNYSKTLAEQKAWQIYEAQNRWELATINPSLVLGPSLNEQVTSESYNIIKQLGSGELKFGAPKYHFAAVDVRDVAIAHFKVAIQDELKGRFIVSADNTNLLELGRLIAERFGDKYPLPQKELPKWLVWGLAPIIGLKRDVVAKNVGHPWQLDNSKSLTELKLEYRDLKQSAQEFFAQVYNEKI
ncbi:MAG: NAD-dependent epimerase/dehydratase family protein [Bdellovibrionales bacterium]|nr:NAD-dependent epimerase/dehydratase family protein [Bdellovibrionales bacterium]